jgi:hypothetical protein
VNWFTLGQKKQRIFAASATERNDEQLKVASEPKDARICGTANLAERRNQGRLIMVNILRRLASSGAVFLLSAAAFFASGSAHATCQIPPHWSASSTYSIGDVVAYDVVSNGTLVSGAFYQSLVGNNTGNVPASSPSQWNGNNILVCKFTVQPVDVCSSTGTNCPLINSLSQTAASNPNTNLIGTINPANPTGPSLDQSAFAQIGVGMGVLPVVLWKSPANPFKTALTEKDYGWLHVCSCNSAGSSTSCPSISSCSLGTSSADLLNVTQQPQIANSTTTSPYTPTFPLNSLHNLNLAFVHFIHPLTAGTIVKGFSWPGNNGGSIAADSVFPAFSPGTVAHELGHQLGPPSTITSPFDGHQLLGAGPLTCPNPYPDPTSECTENLLTAGSSQRQLPNGLNNCGPSQNQACWVPQVPPSDTTPPSALDLLTTGGVGQCTTATISTCPSQQAAYLLSNLLDSIPNTVSQVSGGSGTTSTQALAQSTTQKSNTSSPAQSSAASPPPCPTTAAGPCFFVSGLTRANPGEILLAYVVTVAQPQPGSPQFTFSSNPFKIISQSRRNLLQDFDEQPLDMDLPYPPCGTTSVLCGEVEFNRNHGQGFGPNDFMQFSLNILKGGAPVGLADLCGAKVVFIYNDGYSPVSVLSCSGSSPPSSLMATSQNQDPMTAPMIVTLPTAITIINTGNCTPTSNNQCSNPMTSGVTDSNDALGLEGGALCFSGGVPIQCPF